MWRSNPAFDQKHGLRDAETLHMIAARLCHQSVLSEGLDTFGAGFGIQPPGHGQVGADELLLSWILIHSATKERSILIRDTSKCFPITGDRQGQGLSRLGEPGKGVGQSSGTGS